MSPLAKGHGTNNDEQILDLNKQDIHHLWKLLPILNRKPKKESPSKHVKGKNKTVTILDTWWKKDTKKQESINSKKESPSKHKKSKK
jgi:hypothetical protein